MMDCYQRNFQINQCQISLTGKTTTVESEHVTCLRYRPSVHGDRMLDVHASVKFIFIELTLKGSACGSNLHPLTIESLNWNSMYESRNVNPIF